MPILTDASLIIDYCLYLRSRGRERAIGDITHVLRQYVALLTSRNQSATTATTADVEAYQALLTTAAATVGGNILAVTTQATRLGVVRAWHRWLRRRGHALIDPAKSVSPPKVPTSTVSAEHMSMQEAHALLAGAAAVVEFEAIGTKAWAIAMRDLAMLSLALATGRRATGLCTLHLDHLHVGDNALRVEREKGRVGRVLPVVPWAIAVAQAYRDKARPILIGTESSPWLFPGRYPSDSISPRTWDTTIRRLHRATCTACPDLVDLSGKTISPHSLRVTFASVLFAGGCGIRVINELMMHRHLSTTAAYTPLSFEALRQALINSHPLAS